MLLLRLRIHLGLKIPRKECGIEIGGTQLSWSEGEVLIIDDSFEHFVWNDSREERMIFILDIPHPDLTDVERALPHQAGIELSDFHTRVWKSDQGGRNSMQEMHGNQTKCM